MMIKGKSGNPSGSRRKRCQRRAAPSGGTLSTYLAVCRTSSSASMDLGAAEKPLGELWLAAGSGRSVLKSVVLGVVSGE